MGEAAIRRSNTLVGLGPRFPPSNLFQCDLGYRTIAGCTLHSLRWVHACSARAPFCLSFFLSFFLSFLLAFSTTSHPPGPLSPPSFAVLLQSSRCWLVVGCGWLSLFPPSFPPPACVCAWNIWTDVKLLRILVFIAGGGNLMFAAYCPTKRAAFMSDITLGRWSHVPSISTAFSCRFPFTVSGNRPSQEPASQSLFHARLPHLTLLIPFWTWRCLIPTWFLFPYLGLCGQVSVRDLDFQNFFSKIGYYFMNDSKGSYTISDYKLKGFSSQRVTQMIQFLSRVISMVVPTIWGNPFQGECRRTDLRIYTF